MEKFVKGDVVVIPFPFSDLTASKRRPALVLADLRGNDILLCQITSQQSDEKTALLLKAKDFVSGTLSSYSYIRPLRIFTADKTLIIRKAGSISVNLTNQVIDNIISVLKGKD
ncbi:MAG: type II toxin-antitoxin system PemK/MazF family toxin [Dysgonamonadaceae bacterium]|jgi:mRNA interferase MazF|nr:type II toxin-antitoxin system PemK/MazF family toxin [Dysgonamonadaceae bacterium]